MPGGVHGMPKTRLRFNVEMSETAAQRWQRRAVSVPVMLGATAVAVFGLPVWIVLSIVADLARGRPKLPTLRTYLFLLQYAINDSVEIVLAPVLWLMAGFGTRLDSSASFARHERLQWWSLAMLERRAEQLLGVRIEIDEASEAALNDVPMIVLSRHVSLFDASLPSLMLQARGKSVRGVVMAEMLADPGFDLIYGRLGSVFIPRDDGPTALAEVRQMVEGADDNTAFVIFPEGRLFRPSVRDRGLARLAEKQPERAERLAQIEHVLAPRPGGVLALLAALPDADVVVVDHAGLEPFPKMADMAAAVPLRDPIRVSATRIRRADIPADPAAQVEWLDGVWNDLDATVAAR